MTAVARSRDLTTERERPAYGDDRLVQWSSREMSGLALVVGAGAFAAIAARDPAAAGLVAVGDDALPTHRKEAVA